MRALLRLGLAVSFVAPAGAAEKPAGPSAADRAVTGVAHEAVSPGKCLIRGTAISADESPLPNQIVRLRNLDTSTIEQVATTDRLGTFSFIAAPETPYVVEIVDQPGHVVAVGQVVVARAGEVAGGAVIVPAAIPAYSNVFKSSIGAVLSALGGTALTALDAGGPPLSPEK
jgi:hypothetical protein